MQISSIGSYQQNKQPNFGAIKLAQKPTYVYIEEKGADMLENFPELGEVTHNLGETIKKMFYSIWGSLKQHLSLGINELELEKVLLSDRENKLFDEDILGREIVSEAKIKSIAEKINNLHDSSKNITQEKFEDAKSLIQIIKEENLTPAWKRVKADIVLSDLMGEEVKIPDFRQNALFEEVEEF